MTALVDASGVALELALRADKFRVDFRFEVPRELVLHDIREEEHLA